MLQRWQLYWTLWHHDLNKLFFELANDLIRPEVEVACGSALRFSRAKFPNRAYVVHRESQPVLVCSTVREYNFRPE